MVQISFIFNWLANLCLQICKEILNIFLAIFVSIVSPIIAVTTILPIHTIRLIVSKYVTWFNPSVGKMLTARSSAFAVDDLYNKPLCNICVLLTLEGDLTPEEFKQTLLREVIQAKKPAAANDELIFPELTKYLHRWGWFYFWKPVKNFNIDNHIVVPTSPMSIVPKGEPEWDHVRTLAYNTALIEKPWTPGQSPWEFHLIRNFQPFENTRTPFGLTGLLLRVHHSLADGYSVFSLLTAATKTKFSWAKPVKLKKADPFLFVLCQKLLWPFRIPYDAVKTILESYDVNSWHGNGRQQKLIGKIYSGYCPIFPLATLKEMKNHFNVSLTAVVLAVFTGAVRNFMAKTGEEVPDVMHALCPLPLKGHPTKLRNFMTGCLMELPIGTEDPVKRLYKIHRHLNSLKTSTVPFTAGLMFPIVGGLFSWMVKPLVQQILPTCLVTNFPGPDRKIDVYGRPLYEINFGGGLMMGNMSIGMSSLSYNGNISILIGLDKGINTKAVCENPVEIGPILAKHVLEEINTLRQQCQV